MFQMNMDEWNRSGHIVVNSTGSNKWDIVVWYRGYQISKSFRKLTVGQRTPVFGVSQLSIRAQLYDYLGLDG